MHNRRGTGKPENFGLAVKKLFKYLKPFLISIIIALVLSSLSAVFSIIGPNKVKDLTNEIASGLSIDQKALEEINALILKDLDQEKQSKKIIEILDFNITDEKIFTIINNPDIDNKEKEKLQEFINTKDIKILGSFSDNLLTLLVDSSKVDDVEITKEDKIILIKNLPNLQNNSIDVLNDIPNSIKQVLFKNESYKKKVITSEDKIAYLTIMSEVKDKNVTNIYQKLDKLPSTIKDFIKPKMNFNAIKNIMFFLLGLYLLSALFNFIQSFIMATTANKFAKRLRKNISHKINRLKLKYFDQNSYGDILSRVTNDVDTIGISMYQSFGSLVGAITLFIGSIIMMFVTNVVMAITAIISSTFGFIFMFIILGKSQKYFLARQVELGKLNGHIEEIYSSHNVVKVYNGYKDASLKFDELNNSVYECNRKSQFLSGLMMPFMNFIGNFGYVCVCVVGALLVINNKIDFGVIVAFIIYVRLFTSPLSQIAQGMTSVQTTLASSERVFKFLEEEELEDESDIKEKLDPDKVKGSIVFDHVKFGYDADRTIIKDFNCKVKPGEKVAIVGPTGAGKTTMVNLLMKFYNIKDGDIIIDGKSIHDLTRENIHDLFIMVLQDTWTFNGTIRDNIKYNKENVTDEEIWKALKTVGVDYFVKSLPKGLDYKLNDNDSISQGQKQLLTIARGMIKDSPFLILDEATSSVDTRTEELVQIAMDKLTKGRTSFIIAHRLSTIKNADIILVMKDGNIIEQGNHEELLKKNGFYAELYNSQFQN